VLTSPSDDRRSGPLEPFEKRALIGFSIAAILQAILGTDRVRMGGGSYAEVAVVAIGIVACAVLWFLRVRAWKGRGIAVPVGLLIATAGFYAAYSAVNAPFAGWLSRFSVPVALLLVGALLLFSDQEWQFQRWIFALAALAFVLSQSVLTFEARSGASALAATRAGVASSGVMGELQMIQVAKAHVDGINARDAGAGIVVSRWLADDDTVVGFGTVRSVPAAFRAEVRGGQVVQFQIYGGQR